MNDQRNINLNSFQDGENNFNPNSSLKDDIVSKIFQNYNNYLNITNFRITTMIILILTNMIQRVISMI